MNEFTKALHGIITGGSTGLAVYIWLEGAPSSAKAFCIAMAVSCLVIDAYTLRGKP